MQQQFEYQPFDRVTVKWLGKEIQCVFFGDHVNRTGGYKVCAFLAENDSIDGVSALPEEIFPGHYDANGNWLPQPGDPCYIILANGSAKNMVVVSGEEYRVTAIGEYDSEKTVFFKRALGFVDEVWHFECAESDPIPQSAILHPGRIKIAE